MRITCISITEQGKLSLRQAISENRDEIKKFSYTKRKQYENTWKEIIIDKGDTIHYNLILKARSILGASYLITKKFTKSVNSAKEYNENIDQEFNKIVNEINTSMNKNGSTENIDYTIEVLQ